MVYINIVVLDHCCCAKKIVMCYQFFREFDEMARGGSNSPSKQHHNPVIDQRFGESNIQVVILPLRVARQTKQTVISSCYARKREILNGKFLVDEPRNRSGNVSKSTNSSV